MNVGDPGLSQKSYSRKTVFSEKFKSFNHRFFLLFFLNPVVYTIRIYSPDIHLVLYSLFVYN